MLVFEVVGVLVMGERVVGTDSFDLGSGERCF